MSTHIDSTELVKLLYEARHYHEALQWQFVIEHDERFNDNHFVDRIDSVLQRLGEKNLSPIRKAGIFKTSRSEASRSIVNAESEFSRSVV